MIDEDDPLDLCDIPRHLGAPVYRWRAAGMMLTDEDLFGVLFISMVVWFMISYLGLGNWGYGVLTLDPFGFFLAGLGMAYGITIFHLVFPDDSLFSHVQGGTNGRSYAAWLPRGDPKWTPSPSRRHA